MIKKLCLGLTAVMLLSTFTACSGNSAAESTAVGTDAGSSSAVADPCYDIQVPENLEKYYGKYDEVITLTQNVYGPEDQTVFYPGDNWKDNQYTEWAEGVLGINWEPKWPAPDKDTATQKLTLAMATGDLPDVICCNQNELNIVKQLTDSGAIIPLDELWEEYASPLVKGLYEDYQKEFNNTAFQGVTIDGKMMAIPAFADHIGPSNIWYREDVLNELGKKIPTTLAELEDVFSAYHAAYPDNTCYMLDKNLHSVDNIFGAFGAYKGIWLNQEGRLVYSSVQPEVKEALATLHDWYEKGYLDKEFVVKDGPKVSEEFIAGNTLSLEERWWVIWDTMPNTLNNLPDAVVNAGPLIEGPDGKSGSVEWVPAYQFWAISKDCEHPEAIIKTLNWAVDSALRNNKSYRERFEFVYPEESTMTPTNNDFLVSEGKDITFQESDYAHPGPGTGNTWFWNRGNNRVWYGPYIVQWVHQLSDEMVNVTNMIEAGSEGETEEEKALYNITKSYYSGFDMLKVNGGKNAAYLATLKAEGKSVINAFQGVPTPTMVEKKAYLDKLELETFIKIITGEKPLDEFDHFVEEWNASGGQKMTEEVNEWYNSVN